MVAAPWCNLLQVCTAENLVRARGNSTAGSNNGDKELTMDMLEDGNRTALGPCRLAPEVARSCVPTLADGICSQP